MFGGRGTVQVLDVCVSMHPSMCGGRMDIRIVLYSTREASPSKIRWAFEDGVEEVEMCREGRVRVCLRMEELRAHARPAVQSRWVWQNLPDHYCCVWWELHCMGDGGDGCNADGDGDADADADADAHADADGVGRQRLLHGVTWNKAFSLPLPLLQSSVVHGSRLSSVPLS
jgi:hypothetical protein